MGDVSRFETNRKGTMAVEWLQLHLAEKQGTDFTGRIVVELIYHDGYPTKARFVDETTVCDMSDEERTAYIEKNKKIPPAT
jgi:hypothetical protein